MEAAERIPPYLANGPPSAYSRPVPRHLISILDLDDDDLDWLVGRSLHHTDRRANGRPLSGRVVGVYFALTSTRTRTAFTTGAMRLGADTIGYGPDDLQLNTGESAQDTGQVLATMLDALVVRAPVTSDQLRVFGTRPGMAVVNAMSADEHPTQALADLATMQQHFGRIDGLKVLYLGEGNNSATALTLALSRYPGAELHLRTPARYGLPDWTLKAVQDRPGVVDETHDASVLPEQVDVVYTTRWQTTGTDKPDANWRELFAPFKVDQALMDRYPDAIFMHDLPAHREEEVEAAVLDGPRSVAFTQAANKLHSAMAALEWCLADD